MLSCRINILCTKLMRNIGYTTEILEQIKRLVWAMNSVVDLFQPLPLPESSSSSRIRLGCNMRRDVTCYALNLAENALTSPHVVAAAVIDQHVSFHSRFKIVRVFNELLRSAADAYEMYGVVTYAEYYAKQALKNPFGTLAQYVSAFAVYERVNKTRCTPVMRQIRNTQEEFNTQSQCEVIDTFIRDLCAFFSSDPRFSDSGSPVEELKTIAKQIASVDPDSFPLPRVQTRERAFAAVEYLARKHRNDTTSGFREVARHILEEMLVPQAKRFVESEHLIAALKELGMDHSRALQEAYNQLGFAGGQVTELRVVLRQLFCSESGSPEKTELASLSGALTRLFASVASFTKKRRLLLLLYETVHYVGGGKARKCSQYFSLYVANFVYQKSRFFNLYALSKLTAIAILSLNTQLVSSSGVYNALFDMDESTSQWYPCALIADSIGLMHKTRLQHSFLEKSLKKRRSLDFSRQQAYYRFSLDCFSALNRLFPTTTPSGRRRSSLEQTLEAAGEQIRPELGGSVGRRAKSIGQDLELALGEGYVVVMLESNLAEVCSGGKKEKEVEIYLSRFARRYDPVTVKLSGGARAMLEEFADIINEFYSVQKENDKRYWTRCYELDSRLKQLLSRFEASILSGCRHLLLGELDEDSGLVQKATSRIRERFFTKDRQHHMMQHVAAILSFAATNSCSTPEIRASLSRINANCETNAAELHGPDEETLSAVTEMIREEAKGIRLSFPSGRRRPVIFIMDSKLNNFPFESLPVIRGNAQPTCRMPTVEHLSFACDKLHAGRQTIDTKNTFFVLNPSKDLASTQRTFEKYFTDKIGWRGVSGKEPREEEVMSALEECEMFVYCGHGAGELFCSCEDLKKIEIRSSALLMGCSSSFFSDNGLYENNGILIAYLTSGR